MNKGIVIQARTGSTRLPGKMLREFANGQKLIEVIIARIQSFNLEVPITLATTENPADDALATIADRMGIACFRGSEANVLSRFISAAQAAKLGGVIRVCADNPFLDGHFFRQVLAESGDSDYCSFFTAAGQPAIATHFGFFCEYASLPALEKVASSTTDSFYLEHVTNYIYTNGDDFKLRRIGFPAFLENSPTIRLTIDTEEDFETCRAIFLELEQAGVEIAAENVVKYITGRPDLLRNMHRQVQANAK